MKNPDLINPDNNSKQFFKEHLNNKLLNANEAALYLGVQLSTLYKKTCYRKIRFLKPGGKLIYFKQSDLDNYMLRNYHLTEEELNEKVINYLNKKI